ncbi:MAG: six-hairpin glycosidase [Lentisphaerae bacterium RIFOXYA12_FULL_48_11]|nr:MAG: six-hairpin glycosidase [Lentisphaerae bacterium RIFOXYA12_FULL_48_11]
MNKRIAIAFLFSVIASACVAVGAKDYPVTPVPFTSVHVQDEFWFPRMETNRTVTVKADFAKCEETGRIDNFAKAGGLIKGEFKGIPFDDSDVFKVIEGASYTLAMHPDPELDKYLDGVIAKIASAQEPDGYIYTARKLFSPDKIPKMSGKERWSHVASSHELYNVGHMYEGAVAHYQATGKKTFLDVAIKNADLICREFAPGKLQIPPGHQEIEIGLCKLYRITGERKYLDLAKFLIDIRGRPETHKLYGLYAQDHKPVVEQDEAVGHAVRAAYLYSGMADVAALTGDESYIKAIGRIWENIVYKKLYLTGGIGARHAGEAFGDNYELPNKSAYNETCAAIANGLLNHRMFLLHGDAKYLDVLERIIYNGFLSGVELTGDKFFYPNPLASGKGYKRSPWFGCACCPVNIVRFIPSIAGYVYAVRDDDVFVNLFIGGTGNVRLGREIVKITQQTRYPWDGQIKITVEPEKTAKFNLNVRIPGWAIGKPLPGDLYKYIEEKEGAESLKPGIKVNGKYENINLKNGFACIERKWKKGDVVDLSLPMEIRRVVANDAVKDDAGLVAIERGPIVYCIEGVDNKNVFSVMLPDDARLVAEHRADLLGGVTVIKGGVQIAVKDDGGKIAAQPVNLLAIPYYAWCNRGATEMNVWLPRTLEKAIPVAAPSIASESKITASHVWAHDNGDALNDQVCPKNSCDHDVSRFTWWDHKGTTEWVQYDFAKSCKISSAQVYWFDDTGRGQCRVPESWKVLYKHESSWRPVEVTSEYGVKKDQFNKVTFNAVETSGLRLEVQLQKNFSGGILEWNVE